MFVLDVDSWRTGEGLRVKMPANIRLYSVLLDVPLCSDDVDLHFDVELQFPSEFIAKFPSPIRCGNSRVLYRFVTDTDVC